MWELNLKGKKKKWPTTLSWEPSASYHAMLSSYLPVGQPYPSRKNKPEASSKAGGNNLWTSILSNSFWNKPISIFLWTSYAVQLCAKPYMLLSCCPIRVSAQLTSLASWHWTPGAAHQKPTTKPKQRSSLPSYKSRRSFGLSSVFPSVSRHVGPNPDVEIIRADAAAEFPGEPSSAPFSYYCQDTHKVARFTSGLALDGRANANWAQQMTHGFEMTCERDSSR